MNRKIYHALVLNFDILKTSGTWNQTTWSKTGIRYIDTSQKECSKPKLDKKFITITFKCYVNNFGEKSIKSKVLGPKRIGFFISKSYQANASSLDLSQLPEDTPMSTGNVRIICIIQKFASNKENIETKEKFLSCLPSRYDI